MKRALILATASLSLLSAVPAAGQGIGHSFFMRGSIVDTDATVPVVCIGKEDGAQVGQTLEVYRTVPLPGPGYKGAGPFFRRELVGHVTVDHIFDDHFAHVSVADGTPALHDIVELRRR